MDPDLVAAEFHDQAMAEAYAQLLDDDDEL
jgi:hypothetical protein